MNEGKLQARPLGATGPLFPSGTLAATPGALRVLEENNTRPMILLARHFTGDCGELPAEDGRANLIAIEGGERIFSAYKLEDGTRIWVITEADRSVTTILLPEEY